MGGEQHRRPDSARGALIINGVVNDAAISPDIVSIRACEGCDICGAQPCNGGCQEPYTLTGDHDHICIDDAACHRQHQANEAEYLRAQLHRRFGTAA